MTYKKGNYKSKTKSKKPKYTDEQIAQFKLDKQKREEEYIDETCDKIINVIQGIDNFYEGKQERVGWFNPLHPMQPINVEGKVFNGANLFRVIDSDVKTPIFGTDKQLINLVASLNKVSPNEATSMYLNAKKGKTMKAKVKHTFEKVFKEGKEVQDRNEIKRLTKLKSEKQYEELKKEKVFFKTQNKMSQYYALEDFLDIFPDSIHDKFPQFKEQEKLSNEMVMDEESKNKACVFEAYLITQAMNLPFRIVDGDKNCYTPAADFITYTPRSRHFSDYSFLGVVDHESGHGTSSKKHLDRKIVGVAAGEKMTVAYKKEEVKTESSVLFKAIENEIPIEQASLKYTVNYLKSANKTEKKEILKLIEEGHKIFTYKKRLVEKYKSENNIIFDFKKELKRDQSEEVDYGVDFNMIENMFEVEKPKVKAKKRMKI